MLRFLSFPYVDIAAMFVMSFCVMLFVVVVGYRAVVAGEAPENQNSNEIQVRQFTNAQSTNFQPNLLTGGVFPPTNANSNFNFNFPLNGNDFNQNSPPNFPSPLGIIGAPEAPEKRFLRPGATAVPRFWGLSPNIYYGYVNYCRQNCRTSLVMCGALCVLQPYGGMCSQCMGTSHTTCNVCVYYNNVNQPWAWQSPFAAVSSIQQSQFMFPSTGMMSMSQQNHYRPWGMTNPSMPYGSVGYMPGYGGMGYGQGITAYNPMLPGITRSASSAFDSDSVFGDGK